VGSNSGEGLEHCPHEQCVEARSEWSTAGLFTDQSQSMGGVGPLHQQVTIGSLPDEVLLIVFKFFVDAMFVEYSVSEKWHTLVHVCRRWRYLVFISPRHLNLQLLCVPPKRSVKEMLDIWPELPIYIRDYNYPTGEAEDNLVAALGLNHRVSGIHFEKTSDSAWETFAPLMQQPFPAASTDLWLEPHLNDAISRSFLSGSSPRLRHLVLVGIPFPTLPKLLLSATNLVRLLYDDIPSSGYISPREMVTGLSALTRLESLSLTFPSPRDLPDTPIPIPPPHACTLLPALTYLRLQGVPAYMEELVAQIDAPLLESTKITLFDHGVLEVSELSKFVCRTDKISLVDRAEVTFESDRISVLLSQELQGKVDPKTLRLCPSCPESDLRLSCLVQICTSCLPTLSPFESLHIRVPFYHRWEDFTDDPDHQWLELLCLFNTMKKLFLSKYVAPRVAQALRGLPAERVSEVLPALENVFISELEPFGPVNEAISKFADARQLSGHPVSIHGWEDRFM